jgi:hypothetical protein
MRRRHGRHVEGGDGGRVEGNDGGGRVEGSGLMLGVIMVVVMVVLVVVVLMGRVEVAWDMAAWVSGESRVSNKPLPKKGKVVAMLLMDGDESEQEDEDEPFELASWG